MPSPRGSGGATGLRRDARIDATTTTSATTTPIVVASMKGRPSIVYGALLQAAVRVAHALLQVVVGGARSAHGCLAQLARKYYMQSLCSQGSGAFWQDLRRYGSNALLTRSLPG